MATTLTPFLSAAPLAPTTRALLSAPLLALAAGAEIHHARCPRLPSSHSSRSLTLLALSEARDEVLPCCRALFAHDHPLFEDLRTLAAVARLLPAPGALTSPVVLDLQRHYLLRPTLDPALEPLRSPLTDAHRAAEHELTQWMGSSAADEVLELTATLHASPELRRSGLLRALLGHGYRSDLRTEIEFAPEPAPRPRTACELAALELDGAAAELRERLLARHHARPRPPGSLLVHHPRGGSSARRITNAEFVRAALTRHELSTDGSVLLLRRSLLALVAHPVLPHTPFQHAVLSRADDERVLETASTLLAEGFGTPAAALRAARTLV